MSTVVKNSVTSESIRFRLVGRKNPLILVPVHVNDKGPYDFILDTGASHCLISQELSAILGVHRETEEEATGAGGTFRLAFGHVTSLAVGSTRQHDVSIAITSELEQIAMAKKCRVDGVLGFGVFKDFSLTIDYQTSMLSFASGVALDSGCSISNAIPFELASPDKSISLVQVIANDEGPFQFMLDTGASRTMVSSELAARLELETIDESPGLGGGGKIKTLEGRLNSLAVRHAIIRDHAVGVGEFLEMLSTTFSTKLDGILGYNFLSQFRVTIDYPSRILELVLAQSDKVSAHESCI